ncbi:chymotrypsinogen B-like [Physella acuta]|uniref:chymotrypsinogen B-like n=1 Tax=Physella acuta TaxID=109671 RepID=UPI0027DB1335|nr:chymotrypsinogen B-like [Physella acuta]
MYNITDVSYTCGTRPLFSDKDLSGTGSLEKSTKILGGHDAEHGSNPWQANLLIDGKHACGGTILSEHWILTAAHCCLNKSKYDVVVGDRDQTIDEEEDEKFQVEQIIIHRNYFKHQTKRKLELKNDIALIKLKLKNGRGIQFNNYVQPACLPDADTVYNTGQQYTISGWGRINKVTRPRILQEARVSLSPRKVCKRSNYDSQSMICVRGSIFTCSGDSGGPLVANTKGFYEVLGIASYGSNNDCKIPRTAFFTKVVRFLAWILSRIRIYGKNKAERTLPPRPRFIR